MASFGFQSTYVILQMLFGINHPLFFRPASNGTVAVVKLVFNETVPLEEIPTPPAVVETLTAAVLNGSAGNISIDVDSIKVLGSYKDLLSGSVEDETPFVSCSYFSIAEFSSSQKRAIFFCLPLHLL